MRGSKAFYNQKGFTLVEIAIVLVIIGIIMGAVAKGKDLMRGMEQKKIYQKFLNEWRLDYVAFFNRTGAILGDQNPPLDGRADMGAGTGPISQEDLITGVAPALGLNSVGITPPGSNIPGNPGYSYRYTDSQGGMHILEIGFLFSPNPPSLYNFMYIMGLTNELAIAVDTMIDGQADGTTGDFIRGDGAAPGAAWDGASPTTQVTARWKMEF